MVHETDAFMPTPDQLGSVDPSMFFTPKLDKQGKEIGFVDPDGNITNFDNGESLVMVRNQEKVADPGNRDLPGRLPFVKTKEGQLISLEEWKGGVQEKSDPGMELLVAQLDRDKLKEVTQSTFKKEVLFGRHFDLDGDSRYQLELVADIVDRFLESKESSEPWQKLQSIIDEGHKKGFLFSTEIPPTWLVDGGIGADVRKVKLNDGKNAISVPTDIRDMYCAQCYASSIRKTSKSSDGLVRGRSTRQEMGIPLVQLSNFLKKYNILK